MRQSRGQKGARSKAQPPVVEQAHHAGQLTPGAPRDGVQPLLPGSLQSEAMPVVQIVRSRAQHPVEFEHGDRVLQLEATSQNNEVQQIVDTSRGQSGPDTQSPRLIVRSTSRCWMSASTASSAGMLPCMSAMTAIRIGYPRVAVLRPAFRSVFIGADTFRPNPDFLRQCRSRLCIVRCDQRVTTVVTPIAAGTARVSACGRSSGAASTSRSACRSQGRQCVPQSPIASR